MPRVRSRPGKPCPMGWDNPSRDRFRIGRTHSPGRNEPNPADETNPIREPRTKPIARARNEAISLPGTKQLPGRKPTFGRILLFVFGSCRCWPERSWLRSPHSDDLNSSSQEGKCGPAALGCPEPVEGGWPTFTEVESYLERERSQSRDGNEPNSSLVPKLRVGTSLKPERSQSSRRNKANLGAGTKPIGVSERTQFGDVSSGLPRGNRMGEGRYGILRARVMGLAVPCDARRDGWPARNKADWRAGTKPVLRAGTKPIFNPKHWPRWDVASNRGSLDAPREDTPRDRCR